MEDLDKSMLGIASEIVPTVQKKGKQEKFKYDPVRGQKIRIEKPKRREETRSDKKKRKANEFWAGLWIVNIL